MSIDVTPNARVLDSIANQPFSWKTVIGELVDNSLDAEATVVAITFEPRKGKSVLVVNDNGNGTPRIDRLVRIGDHGRQSSTQLGTYGIGAKDAALMCGGVKSTFTVRSTHLGTTRQVKVAWSSLIENGWKIDDPLEMDQASDERGTLIRIRPCIRTVPKGKAWEKLKEQIGYLYSKAIRHDGVQITFERKSARSKPEIIAPWEPPEFEGEVVNEIVQFDDGRKAKVYCGVVSKGHPNPRCGLTYRLGYRVVKSAGGYGCGNYSILRVCGFVQLSSGWRLTKNKDEIVGADDLYEEVERVCRPVLERAHQQSSTLESAAFELQVSSMLNELASGLAKAKRSKGDKKGSKAATGKGGRHKRAKDEQDGRTFVRRASSGGDIKIEHREFDDDRIGKFSAPRDVHLNINNPIVSQCKDEQNQIGTVILSAMILSAEASFNPSESSGQRLMFRSSTAISSDPMENYVLLAGQILGSDVALDGSKVHSRSDKDA